MKENTRRLRDLAINGKKRKKEKKYRSVASRSFPSTWLIVRKARGRDFARPTISLLGQRGLSDERSSNGRGTSTHRLRSNSWEEVLETPWHKSSKKGSKEGRKEGKDDDWTREFPSPGNQFHRTSRRGDKIQWLIKGETSLGNASSLRISAPVSNTVTRPTRRLFQPPPRTLTSLVELISNSRLREPP